jgi:hypothetical protein
MGMCPAGSQTENDCFGEDQQKITISDEINFRLHKFNRNYVLLPRFNVILSFVVQIWTIFFHSWYAHVFDRHSGGAGKWRMWSMM